MQLQLQRRSMTCVDAERRVLYFLLTVTILILAGCSDINDKRSLIFNEECDVYKTMIGALYGDEVIAIMSETVPADSKSTNEKKFIQSNLDPLIEKDTLTSYQVNNRVPNNFDPKNCLNVKYVRLTEKERKEIFEIGGGWSLFQARYPESSKVLITFSKVGFNSQLDQALVFVQSYGDYGAGEGLYILLDRSSNEWIIQRMIVAWVA
jgi:hypothetical protein